MATSSPHLRLGIGLSEAEVSSGLQLLSPTFQQSIQRSTLKLSSSLSDWRSTSSVVHAATPSKTKDAVEFDFDGFTLEAVRGRKRSIGHDTSARLNSGTVQIKDYHAFYYDERFKPNPLSSSTGSIRTTTTTEDLELSRLRRPPSLHHDVALQSGDRSGMQSTFQLSPTAAAAGFPMAKKKQVTAVVMRGWLRKRKGLVLRRWKPYYCLFKSDDSLCLYASEDTVNGKLDERYHVLRIGLTDKNDAFHVIGVDTDGSPRREELRVVRSGEWNHWFQVFHRFFDTASLNQARARVPHLTFATAFRDAHTKELIDSYSGVSSNDQSSDEQSNYFGPKTRILDTPRDSLDGSLEKTSLEYAPSLGRAVSGTTLFSETAHVNVAKLAECPMIERRSQGSVPILETRAFAPLTKPV